MVLAKMHRQGLKFTMSDLARELGVSKRTIYESFPGKEAIISEILRLSLEDVNRQRHDVLADSTLTLVDKIRKS